jgi:hypothetical protein
VNRYGLRGEHPLNSGNVEEKGRGGKMQKMLSRIGECSRMNLRDGGHCEIIFPMTTLNLSVE